MHFIKNECITDRRVRVRVMACIGCKEEKNNNYTIRLRPYVLIEG
jgi:hypothetical protein